MRSVTPPSALPGISPSRGKIALSIGPSPITNFGRLSATLKLPISPLEGEMSGRTEGGWRELDLYLAIARDDTAVLRFP
ncbi:hypothetical protein EN817_22730 [Mesorhizobium sp. M3A.F.Ca.ET.174.01.1.1]|nr:hypothetical protein EJ074_27365 [Mesorhizobium sp. M3A.F.Ca.ET.080.04.2.1]PBB85929.1 hypothetical protein CK216_15020 [Mesorhizobium sp. WSM3876]RWB69403.1 MAG: hypothetical protein EOQ49_20260 [Mesorhizobium sp.]TGS68118.1 hypothetical protein EN844_12065 [Mesorhizobium sp. M3A.F.Ca.ET.201.01.1.1]TGS84917.1 hypothetical protein EN818_22940 [Mesorhizobium sp. M3A.F.Ca.ET.175.01.1.1]TGT23320.1 hypothetical protein EN817_22730 [Mesorhizobium sp. M3A.F.Ca.ET.174.01.1.1]TGT59423.1 hypothetica